MDKRLPPIILPVFGVDAKRKLEIFVIFYSFRAVVIVGTGLGVGGWYGGFVVGVMHRGIEIPLPVFVNVRGNKVEGGWFGLVLFS